MEKITVGMLGLGIMGSAMAKNPNELKCPTPLFAASAQIYTSALSHGLDKEDTASVCRVLAEMAGLRRS
jgi:3-hydroxyisobutyrate dehydrogenase-like beta-hydroxyacid dehydrogenase